MKIEEVTINNLKTYFIHYPGAQSNSTQIWFRAGSSLEKPKDHGVAHFLEHMFFKGTKKRPGSKIAKEIESFGGDVNAFTSFDYTCYYINSPKDYLNQSLEILLDMVSNPLFEQSELVPEREVVLEEYKRSIDNPGHFHFHHMQEKSFSSGYSHPILGNPKTISSFTRKQIIDFRKKHYNTSNAALVIAGDFQHIEKSKKIISKYKLPNGPKSNFNKFKVKTSKKNIFVNKTDVKQASLSLIYNAPHYNHANATSEDLAINCFAYGETSYLHKKLVKESGLATATSGSTMFMNSGGAHLIKLVFPLDKMKKVLNEYLKLMKQVSKDGFTKQDLQKIKNQYIASKVYELETIDSLSFSLGHGFAQSGDIHSDQEFIDRIKATELSPTNAAIETVFTQSPQIHIQIPNDQDDKSIKVELADFSSKLQALKFPKAKIKNLIPTSIHDSQVQTIKLKKGITLLYRHNPATPTFSFHAYLKGGLAAESLKTSGTHYQIAKNFTYGHKFKDYQNLKLDLSLNASSLSGFSGKNAYGVTLHGLSEHFKSLSDDFFSTLLTPVFPEYYLEIEKNLLTRYFEDILTSPVKQCFKAFQTEVFKGTDYEPELMGSLENFPQYTSKKLKNMHQKNLKNSEILLTYCGDKSLSEVQELCETKLDKLTARSINKFKPFKVDKLEDKTIKIDFDREQNQIFIGQRAYHLSDKNDIYLKMLTQYLSGQSSELFVDVRDKQGLCYSCQPVHHTALQMGYWGIYIGTSHEKTEKAINAIEKLLAKIAKKGIKDSEVKRIKKMISGSLQLQLQCNEDYANFYSIPQLHNLGVDFEHSRIELIKNAKTEDFNKFLKKFLKQKRITVIAGKS